ncbi:unnamed protein product [Prorocentrum cordatum]|uniref:6-pyruvoyltetrahydropterin synthase n=1 Tax=Prorocentrum cordatum TaxID=2364126 RepID=A0ABN9X6S4_9DINO|nr:unnamed protein product [Polarella glacialis]
MAASVPAPPAPPLPLVEHVTTRRLRRSPSARRCCQGSCLRAVGTSAAEAHSGLPRYHVSVQGEQFKFSCAHFVAYKGFRERLHGHNYTVAVGIDGPRLDDGYTLDFGILKRAIRTVCKELNEHLIVPMRSDVITITVDDTRNQLSMVCEDGASFSVPVTDCALLPLVHSTAEELAEYIHSRLVHVIGHDVFVTRRLHLMQVTISERPPQSATYIAPTPADAKL